MARQDAEVGGVRGVIIPPKIISNNQRGYILPSPTMLLGGVAVALGISTMLFLNLYKGALNDFANFRASVEAINAQIAQDNAAKLITAIKERDANANGWLAATADLDKRPVIRVQSDCGARQMRGTAPASTSTHAPAAESAPSPQPDAPTEISVTEAESTINRGLKDSAQVLWLQDYILGQQEAYK